jgi:hypothetical protein
MTEIKSKEPSFETLSKFLFTRDQGTRKPGTTEHEQAVNDCIPEAVDIANVRIRRDLRHGKFKTINQRNNMAMRHFLQAMDEITAAKGLRVVPRTGKRAILFRKFD